jgi:hypothetical protein
MSHGANVGDYLVTDSQFGIPTPAARDGVGYSGVTATMRLFVRVWRGAAATARLPGLRSAQRDGRVLRCWQKVRTRDAKVTTPLPAQEKAWNQSASL